MFPADAARASERRLALSSGVANLALAPFGAIADVATARGGLQAQYRFGARTGPGADCFSAEFLS